MADTNSEGSLYNTGVRPYIDNWLLEESKKVRDYGEFWSASSAGYCYRKVMFERLKIPHVVTDEVDEARLQRVFTAGHIFHEWAQGITKAAGVSIGQEMELLDSSLMVRGHFDDLIEIDGKTILYDYKTRNSKNFDFAKKPSHFHKMQLMTYVVMLRKEYPELIEARTLNIEKDTLRMIEVAYIYSKEVEQDIYAYWNGLSEAWEKLNTTGELPPCTCHKHENGFMSKERFNPYFKDGQPCSTKVYEEWKNGRNTSGR